ncbi:MAG: isochorismatase family protein [Phycisphaerae bacterium]|jgi:nicotinamidase-related amidase|nr:isochorismatase family protein [Phycisphaerae bacterium]MCZ2401506.1 isochorismatase family protein [Phycisphaerae bacterium]NUQ49337.1 isochorismatase family protein [Phycisphaerae bacterium]
MLRLRASAAQLLVIDFQERLMPHIFEATECLAQAVRMIAAARPLGLPVTVSEQYVRGLGSTTSAVLEALKGAERFEKMSFSACGDARLKARLMGAGREQVLICGVEAHVCVQQTALDLAQMGLRPVILADAVSSRRALDRDVAIERLRGAGVLVTTVEAAIFEMLDVCGTELFKRILPLVR